jgi:hypothetical protein
MQVMGGITNFMLTPLNFCFSWMISTPSNYWTTLQATVMDDDFGVDF